MPLPLPEDEVYNRPMFHLGMCNNAIFCGWLLDVDTQEIQWYMYPLV